MVPSPPSTMSTSSFCRAASANERSISLASPHQTFGSTMPARVRILKIFCSDSESQPPLEVLIMAPTFNSDKRMPFDSIWQYSRQDILSDLPSPEVSFL